MNWHQVDCPGCKIDLDSVKKAPKQGLVISRVIYSTTPIEHGLCKHNLNVQLELF